MYSSTPGEDRRASSPFAESLATFMRRLAGEFGIFFTSPRWARFGGVAFVFAGVAGVSALLVDVLVIRCEFLIGQQAYGCGGGFQFLSDAARSVGSLLIALGVIGLCMLPKECSTFTRRLAGTGAALVALLAILWGVLFVRESFTQPFYASYMTFFPIVSPLNGVQLLGMLFVCLSAFWSRGLGAWRWLPGGIWLLLALPPQVSLLTVSTLGADEIIYVNGFLMTNGTIFGTVMFQSPHIAADISWILLGIVMFGAKERGERIVAGERRATEERNLALARRIYEEAWGGKKLLIVDEIVSEDFFDKRRNRSGSAAFKQAISDLHHAFPDLKADIPEQTAEGDEVFTRITFSGADRGGVLYYPPTNRTAKFTATFTDRFEDGELAEHDGEMDEETLMEQLGLPSER